MNKIVENEKLTAIKEILDKARSLLEIIDDSKQKKTNVFSRIPGISKLRIRILSEVKYLEVRTFNKLNFY